MAEKKKNKKIVCAECFLVEEKIMQVEFILLILSLLFFVSIIADKIGYKFGVPALLLFLAVGMLFGHDGIGALLLQGIEHQETGCGILAAVVDAGENMGVNINHGQKSSAMRLASSEESSVIRVSITR